MEEIEDIPWSSLVPDEQPPAYRPWIFAGAVVAAVIVGMLGARLLGGSGRPPEPPALAVVDESTTTVAVDDLETPVLGDLVMSEADLMALVPTDDDLAEVRLRAEWFATDYFTVDPDLGDPVAVRGAMAVEPDVLPHDLPQPGTSYVDFARAGSVEILDAGSYAVDVVVRRVVRTADGVTRMPADRVTVVVGFVSGGTEVLDLPAPIGPPPETVITGTTTAADGTVRIEAIVLDEAGMSWPMAWRGG